MSEKHSPLPWKLWGAPNPQQVIASENGFIANSLGGNDLANAQYIVRACNAFPKLVEALEMQQNARIMSYYEFKCHYDIDGQCDPHSLANHAVDAALQFAKGATNVS